MGIEWDDRGRAYGRWYGTAEGVHLQLHQRGLEGWRLIMWGPRVPEDRQYPPERYPTPEEAMAAAEKIVAGLLEDSD